MREETRVIQILEVGDRVRVKLAFHRDWMTGLEGTIVAFQDDKAIIEREFKDLETRMIGDPLSKYFSVERERLQYIGEEKNDDKN